MRSFDVPQKAFIELPREGRLEVKVVSIQNSALWMEAAEPVLFGFRMNLRVTFPFASGSIGFNAEIINSNGDRGFGVLVAHDTDPHTKAMFDAWTRGQPAIVDLGRRRDSADLPTLDLRPDGHDTTEDLQATRARRVAPVRPALPSLALAGRAVLVVDDDPLVARALQAGLQRRGGSVFLASDGAKAIEIIRHKHVDAVLLDWMMPVMAGGRVLADIRRDIPAMPIAVVSGIVGSMSMRHAVRKLGADEVFSKPFEITKVCDWVVSRASAV